MKSNNNFLDNKKLLKVILLANNDKMKALLYFNLTAKKKPLSCIVETFGHRMYCIYWPVMTQLKKGVNFSPTKLFCI